MTMEQGRQSVERGSATVSDPLAPVRSVGLVNLEERNLDERNLEERQGVPWAVRSWEGGVDRIVAGSAESVLDTGGLARMLAVLDDPSLVVSDQYIGPDRRRTGSWAWIARATYPLRRTFLRLDVAVLLCVVGLLAAILGLGFSVPAPVARRTTTPKVVTEGPSTPRGEASSARKALPASPAPAAATPVTSVPAAATPAPVATPATPEAMGAAALQLVHYPWQKLPGYRIDFASISEAPAAGFFGNTVFTWGVPGGVSTMYVFPGETVSQLAGITAFEIGHEVDASLVEPRDGHDAIESILGVHPSSWAPECDCAEQGYLSGWFAAAFAAMWSPGVGQWSQIAPLPSGRILDAVTPWLSVTPS